MPIPDFQTLMLPLLESLADGKERLMRDVTGQLADRFELSEEERQQKLPSGEGKLFVNRVAWAKAHLKAAGLIGNPARGKVRISKVVLIDGERLAKLMIEHGVGVSTSQVYELKEVSNDFFDEDEG